MNYFFKHWVIECRESKVYALPSLYSALEVKLWPFDQVWLYAQVLNKVLNF